MECVVSVGGGKFKRSNNGHCIHDDDNDVSVHLLTLSNHKLEGRRLLQNFWQIILLSHVLRT